MAEEKAQGQIHEQKDTDNKTSHYDDAGDKVKKNESGTWIKDTSADATTSTTSTKSTTSTTSTTSSK